MATPVSARARTRCWTRAEDDRLIREGLLDEDDPIELRDDWMLDLVDRGLEVSREPVRSSSAPVGWKYAHRERFQAGLVVSPLARPRARARVADLLP